MSLENPKISIANDEATLRSDVRDIRDERAGGGITMAASAPEANACCSSELLNDTDSAGLGGGAAVPDVWCEATTEATQHDDPTRAVTGQSKSQLTYVPQHPYVRQHTG